MKEVGMRIGAAWSQPVRYALALAIVAVGYAARTALDPVFGDDHIYTAFYPGVILAAYFLGARPAILAAVLSASTAYIVFAPPELRWHTNLAGLTTLGFFGLTSSVSIYFITGMGRMMAALAVERSRAEALARNHASLFQELNERVTNHLQLVAALLQVQARDEADPAFARALAEASARTLLISRVHRDLSGDDQERSLDFDAFARQLLDVTLASRGNGGVRVDLRQGGLKLSPDQATSVAVVLLECLNARLQADTPAELSVTLRGDERELVLEISERCGLGMAPDQALLQMPLIEAMVEQLGGRFSIRTDDDQSISALAFPRLGRTADPLRAAPVIAPTVPGFSPTVH